MDNSPSLPSLPAMTVEQRNSTTAHGIPAPPPPSMEELGLAIELNHLATMPGWPARVIEILQDYSPIELPGPAETRRIVSKVMGMNSWKEVSAFVVDDMCSDFYNLALRYCLQSDQPHAQGLDFIDGPGIGYLERYRDRLKVVLEKAFDAKYYYKKARPLDYALNQGLDLRGVANAINPGHWAFPQGHQVKIACAVECLDKDFSLSDECYRELLICAVLAAQGRCGSLIHYPLDAYGSLYLLELRPEYPLKQTLAF